MPSNLPLSQKTVHYYKAEDLTFEKDMQIAYSMFQDRVDGELTTRAFEGTETPIFYRGEQTTTAHIPDNRLLETVAKAHLPHLYDRKSMDRIPDHDKPQLNVNIISFNDTSLFPKETAVGMVTEVRDDGSVRRATFDEIEAASKESPEDEGIIDV